MARNAARVGWSATQYTLFERERTRPVRDLLAAVPTDSVDRAVDLGCGPGNSTQALAARYPQAQISGLDSSAEMIAAARKRLPNLRFDVGDLVAWQPDVPVDFILANAVLQWIPEHAAVLSALAEKLTAGGTLAVQMPDNLDEPAHRLMREIARDGAWSEKLAEAVIPRPAVAGASWYYALMQARCRRVDVWRTIYHHPLVGGAAAVVEWFKGSGLRPYLSPLNESDRAEYLRRYMEAIAAAYQASADGTVLLPFPRLFIVASR